MTRNVAQSIRDRLLALARARGEDFNHVLVRYGLERLVARIAASRHADEFVLKGAILFSVWTTAPHRATRDLDLLGFGPPDLDRIAGTFQEIADHPIPDDGLIFDRDAIAAERIKEDDDYQVVRVRMEARLGAARIPLQIDVGFGDAVTPAPELVELPTLLPATRPAMRAYTRDTVVAEKLHAMVQRGTLNSRMKDYFDLWVLAGAFGFAGETLVAAILATFARRGTPIPRDEPAGLSDRFVADAQKRAQWRSFISRTGVARPDLALEEVVPMLRRFLGPPLGSTRAQRRFSLRWAPGGPWSPSP